MLLSARERSTSNQDATHPTNVLLEVVAVAQNLIASMRMITPLRRIRCLADTPQRRRRLSGQFIILCFDDFRQNRHSRHCEGSMSIDYFDCQTSEISISSFLANQFDNYR